MTNRPTYYQQYENFSESAKPGALSPYAIWAANILAGNGVILDTETTGMKRVDQIISLAIIDMQGDVLFDSLIRPSVEIDSEAYAIHRMTERHLANAPRITQVIDQAKAVLAEFRPVIIYNVDFDRRLLRQTHEAFGLDATWLDTLNYQCAMRAYSESLGAKRWVRLEGGDHTALGDCKAVLELLKRMAEGTP